MRRFARLYEALDRTTSTNAKIDAMVDYFERVDPTNAAWAVFFLSGERIKSPVRVRTLAEWATELSGIEDWMFEASYEAVGDLAETVSLIVDAIPNRSREEPWAPGLAEVVDWLRTLRDPQTDAFRDGGALPDPGVESGTTGLDKEAWQKRTIVAAWKRLDRLEIFVLGKLMTGALRVGVSKRLVVRALAKWSGVDRAAIFHRLMGNWQPSAESFAALFDEDTSDADRSRPYPYFLASPLESDVETLGEPSEWQVEWKWDGIRAQLIRRGGDTFIWSRGEELVTAQYPEIADAASMLPDGTVLDGEIVAFKDGAPLPFNDLQRRIGRKRVGKTILKKVPVIFMTYDQMEVDGGDIREWSMERRRETLQATVADTLDVFRLSEVVDVDSWDDLVRRRTESRERGVEGLMLKRRSSPYRIGRTRGDWWKWKVDPYEVDAVMIYAQPGHGRRASLYTDYTFAVWSDDDELVPIAKAYSGLSNDEIKELDRWIRSNTLDKFGPVRAVEPEHVFELHFENVVASRRHKSGIAVRFPRISRWRRDKSPADANHLRDVEALVRDL